MAASIRGTVKNTEGRPIRGVKVVAAHEPTGSQFARLTDNEGQFVFDNIKVGGPYALTASREGLVPVQSRLQLKTEQAVHYDIRMSCIQAGYTDGEPQTSA